VVLVDALVHFRETRALISELLRFSNLEGTYTGKCHTPSAQRYTSVFYLKWYQ
jgi:hypothetical protein